MVGMSLEESFKRVQNLIAAAAKRSGRTSNEVKLVAVSKKQTAENS